MVARKSKRNSPGALFASPDEPRRRAKRGTIGSAYLLKLDAALDSEVRAAAAKAGIGLAQWLRDAAAEKILRTEAHRHGLVF